MKNRFVHYGAVLLIIAAVSAGVLGAVNDFTKTVIQENELKTVNQARMKVLSVAKSFKQDEAVTTEGLEFIPGYNEGGELVGYVTTVAQPGYGGDIKWVMGITKDELTLRLDRVNGWINNCDQKSSILLAIEGVVLTILCTSDYISFIHQQLIFPIYNYYETGNGVFSIINTVQLFILAAMFILIFLSIYTK